MWRVNYRRLCAPPALAVRSQTVSGMTTPEKLSTIWSTMKTSKNADLIQMHHVFFGKPMPEDQLPISEDVARELQAIMRAAGFSSTEPNGIWDDDARKTFNDLVNNENLEERRPNPNASRVFRQAHAGRSAAHQ